VYTLIKNKYVQCKELFFHFIFKNLKKELKINYYNYSITTTTTTTTTTTNNNNNNNKNYL